VRPSSVLRLEPHVLHLSSFLAGSVDCLQLPLVLDLSHLLDSQVSLFHPFLIDFRSFLLVIHNGSRFIPDSMGPAISVHSHLNILLLLCVPLQVSLLLQETLCIVREEIQIEVIQVELLILVPQCLSIVLHGGALNRVLLLLFMCLFGPFLPFGRIVLLQHSLSFLLICNLLQFLLHMLAYLDFLYLYLSVLCFDLFNFSLILYLLLLNLLLNLFFLCIQLSSHLCFILFVLQNPFLLINSFSQVIQFV
jgi:hypothetical protein